MEFLTQNKYVVIDFETTGNRAKEGDQIIQVGMCVIENGTISERFSSYVKPTIGIPAFIEHLTGITDDDVRDAPTVEELLPEIIKRMDQACFVAHNVHFDLSFYQHMLEEQGYYPFKGMILDTVELARILYPDQEGYKLRQLASEFDMEHEHPHQADSDALAAAHLFIQLCEQIDKLPLITIQRMIPLTKSLHSDIEVLLRRAESDKIIRQTITSGMEQDYDIYRHFALKKIVDPVPHVELQQDLTMEQRDGFDLGLFTPERIHEFNIGQWLSPILADYEAREGQQIFFEQIIHNFRAGQHGVGEIGTGTGKTMAYLLAAALWAYTTKEKVLISTHTIPLQEQILVKEWPLIEQALPLPIQASVLKGKHHYLCLSRFENAFLQQDERNYDYDLTKLQLLVWLTQTKTGDVEELNLSAGGREFWKRVQTEGSSCFQRECPWFQRCFYYKAKRVAQQAEIVVTNHSLLISDDTYRHALPAYRYAIIDEAHHFEQVAIEHYGEAVHYAVLHSLLQRLIAVDRSNLATQLSQIFQLLVIGEELDRALNELVHLLQELKELLEQFFTTLFLYAEEKEAAQEGNKKHIRLQHHLETTEVWVQVLQMAELLQNVLTNTFVIFARLRDRLDEQKDELSFAQQQIIHEFKQIGEQVEEHVQLLLNNILTAEPHSYVYWFEYDNKGNRYSMSVQKRPLHVSELLQTQYFEHKESVMLTSATIRVNQSFDYFLEQIGLQQEHVSLLQIPSPFDYGEQAKVLISEDISLLSEVSELEFAVELADSIQRIAQITEGRMLVLFTSYRLLRLTHEHLKAPLHESGIFLFAQGIDSGSRMKLSKNFQSQDKAVLLGTSSFWEGIDIPGEDLSCLVIVKLPFTPPNTPFHEAKAEKLKEMKKNPFMDYALPQAVIRFKQGFGRLIRKATDRGVVVIFDRRIIEARYGKVFLQSLPAVPVDVVEKQQMLADIQRWFEKE